MKKINNILAGIFLSGVLLIGIGAGVAFWEYSSFEYQGEHQIGEGKEKKEVLEYKIPSKTDQKKICLIQNFEKDYTLVEDKNIPKNVIQYEIIYNPEFAKPELCFEEADYNYFGNLYLSFHSTKSDFEVFMEYKDQILEELKKKKIASYRYDRIKEITIRVNPKTMKKVEESNTYY